MTAQTNVVVNSAKGLSTPAVTFVFLLGIFMGALDHGIVGPALSSIMAEYGLRSGWGVWSFTVYTLLFAVSIPICGKLSDRFGRKPVFAAGIALFGIGSLLCAFAPTFSVFLLGRAVQAIGTGGIFPITGAQIAASYPPEKRGRMLGLIGVSFGVGTILGPVVGGLIIANLPWQWIFLVNVPISIIILLLISTYRTRQETVRKPIDFAGIGLLTVVVFAIMYGVSAADWKFIAAGLVIVPIFLRIEKRQPDPILNVRYVTNGSIVVLLIGSLFSGYVMATATNMLPYFAERVLGIPRGDSGISVTPLAIASMVASLVGGILVDKIGAKRTLVAGFALVAAGALSLAFLVEGLPEFLSVLVLLGFGVGIVIGAPLNVLMLQAVEPNETGSAIGYLSLFRSLGSTLGPTMAGMFLVSFANGFAAAFLVSGIVSAVAIVVLLTFARGARRAGQ
ncbi:MFS transporter [Paenibacillus antri]|uniref:MFS transporter n=1 Tax=Paenibacillus antri TaxID=2582848 RepID=A0A5R9GDM2_9BACL|nr:MFS transporter [Paenibacillus antri]TLS53199.1 MFS transporter [Paenibacillus antri]